jgi:hypothetical protein
MNKNLTWKQLAEIIAAMPSERQADNVTVYDFAQDEYVPASDLKFTHDNDVLDDGARYLVINE